MAAHPQNNNIKNRMLGVDCHVIQSKCLRATTAPPYVPEIISVFLHIDYSANLLRMVEGVTTMREKVYTSPSTLFPHIPFFFFLDVCERIYIESIFRQAKRFFFHPFFERVPTDWRSINIKRKNSAGIGFAKQKNKYNIFSLNMLNIWKY